MSVRARVDVYKVPGEKDGAKRPPSRLPRAALTPARLTLFSMA